MSAHNLPSQPTAFIGREAELAEISDLLAAPDCRLLTLTGPGGIGKTRLGLEAARLITDENVPATAFSHGVYFVPMQPLTSTDFIIPTIANSLKFIFYDERDPRVQLLDYLHSKHLLLVMDNFEHLLDSADLLPEILAYAPAVKILVTSRERLRLQEEWVLDIHGLPFPEQDDIEAVEDYTAIQLFVQNARRAGYIPQASDAGAIMQICRLVEGIPLAIELAAAWVRILPCEAIAREVEHSLDILTTSLRNVPEKHRSMHAVFEHSWNLLSENEQAVFRKLSVFRGGFRREAAEAVTGANLAILASLVDRSMLRMDTDGRYSLQELLRQYAHYQLDCAGETESTGDAHCAYYAGFLDRRVPVLKGPDQIKALDEIETELDNVRVSWRRAVAQGKQCEIEQ
ncbi:MAG TPA: AAA family ATPase, partial [Aggregatilineales bacterium]|nr:AAA family ATPase [Aggregatilineales bacterium]